MTLPLLSANRSVGTPTLSSSVTCRLVSGVGSAYLMCRPPLMPAPPPATRSAGSCDRARRDCRGRCRAGTASDRAASRRRPCVALQLLEQVREQRHVIRVDLRQLRELLRRVLVMRRRVMRLGDADLRIGPRAHLARELERDDARDVGLQREHLQVEHQLRVLFPIRPARRPAASARPAAHRRPAARPSECAARPRAACRDTRRRACGRDGPRRRPQPRHVLGHPVENAAVLAQLGLAIGGRAAVAEQPLEHHARVRFGRQRGRLRRTTPACSCTRS